MSKLRPLRLTSSSPSDRSALGTDGDPRIRDVTNEELEAMKATLHELVGAVGEYGHHLRSHTSILKSMSEASQSLAAIVAELHVHMKARDRSSWSSYRGNTFP